MKRITYSLLLIFLFSCGPQSELHGNRIRVQFRDSLIIPHEYVLLSVRDSALVVGPGYYDPNGPPQLIPLSKIDRIYHAGDGKAIGAVLGGVIGCTAVMVPIAIASSHNTGSEGAGILAAALAGPAIIIGAVIGSSLVDPESSYDLSSANNLIRLRNYSLYPDHEPPELQKIK